MTSKEAREFLRSHVLGLVAIFIALTGTAVASQQSGTSGGPKASASVVTDAKFKKLKKRVAALEAKTTPTTLPPSGPAGGSLAGTYPNPQLGPIVRRVGQFSGTISANTGFSVSADCDPGEVAISGGSTWATASPPIRWRAAGWTPTPGPSRTDRSKPRYGYCRGVLPAGLNSRFGREAAIAALHGKERF